MFGSPDTPRPQAPALPDPVPAPPSYAAGGAKPGGNQSKIPGFGSTLLTSPLGVDSSATNVARKSLLGS